MTGWECPKCGKVYAPSVVECVACNNTVTISDPVSPYVPTYPPPEPYVLPQHVPWWQPDPLPWPEVKIRWFTTTDYEIGDDLTAPRST